MSVPQKANSSLRSMISEVKKKWVILKEDNFMSPVIAVSGHKGECSSSWSSL